MINLNKIVGKIINIDKYSRNDYIEDAAMEVLKNPEYYSKKLKQSEIKNIKKNQNIIYAPKVMYTKPSQKINKRKAIDIKSSKESILAMKEYEKKKRYEEIKKQYKREYAKGNRKSPKMLKLKKEYNNIPGIKEEQKIANKIYYYRKKHGSYSWENLSEERRRELLREWRK